MEAGGISGFFAILPPCRLTTLNGGGTVRTRFVVTVNNTAYFPATFYNYFTAESGGTVAYYQQGSVTLTTDIRPTGI